MEGRVERSLQRRSLFEELPNEDPEVARKSSMRSTKAERRRAATVCGLTKMQQRLALCFTLWFLGGLYMYMARKWGKEQRHYSFVEAVYVMVQIITTVGYGDLVPCTPGGYLFTALYVITAVMVLSSIVSTVTELVIRSEDSLIKNALASVSTDVSKASQRLSNLVGASTDLEAARSLEVQEDPEDPAGATEDMGGYFHVSTVTFLRAMGIWCLFVAAGTWFFARWPGEGKSVPQAAYMSVITLTTVGFGDETPKTEAGRVFACVWMLLGVASFANMVAKFAAFVMAQDRIESLDRGFLLQIQEDPFYQKCHPDEDCGRSKVTRADFVLFMMDQMGLLDDSVVESLSQNFDELDRDRSGYLDGSDIAAFSDKLRRSLTVGRALGAAA